MLTSNFTDSSSHAVELTANSSRTTLRSQKTEAVTRAKFSETEEDTVYNLIIADMWVGRHLVSSIHLTYGKGGNVVC